MCQYSIEPRTIKYEFGYEFLSFARKYKKQLLDTGLGDTVLLKTVATGTKSNDDNIEKKEPVIFAIVLSEKSEEILNKLRKLL